MSNTFGERFRVTTFGESHGPCVGAVVDGCPALLELSEADIQWQLDRRRPGQSDLTTPRSEGDRVQIVSGIENGVTLGTPIGMLVRNRDTKPSDYKRSTNVPRPSHADFTYRAKYGIAATTGGGRASARETVGRVASGALAEKILVERYGIELVGWVSRVGPVESPAELVDTATREAVDALPVRCPDADTAERMMDLIRRMSAEDDSVGGIVTCVCRNVPAGWGEPVFNKMEAALARAMLSIPAAKGFDIGSGFGAAGMRGSEHNDMYVMKAGHRLGTVTNRSGGVQGGITNGEPLVFRVVFKPAATIKRAQSTVDYEGQSVTLRMEGRHDPCVLPRAVPVVESMAALVLADMALLAAPGR